MTTNQEERQNSFRGLAGTSLSYNGDFMSVAAIEGFSGTYNEVLTQWLQFALGSSSANINDLKQAYAKSLNYETWDSIRDVPLPLVGGGGLTSLATFTRASSGTYFDSSGVLQTATTNEARIDHFQDGSGNYGLLVEEARTNILLQSEDLTTTWTNFNSTETANTTIAPDGATTADMFVRSSTSSSYIAQAITKAASAIEYTFSAFVHRTAGTGDYVALRCQGAFPARVDVVYRKSTNAITSSVATTFTGLTSGVETINDDWVRIWMTFTTDAVSGLTPVISSNDNGVHVDGTSGSSDTTSVFWGMQLEVGSFATSYIKTTTSSVTRAADVCTIDLSSANWFNSSEGTIVIDFLTLGWSKDYQTMFSFGDGTTGNTIGLRVRGDTEALEVSIIATTTQTALTLESPITHLESRRVAIAYKANDVAACLNGGTVGIDNTVTLPAMTDLYIGDIGSGSRYANAIIPNFRYYPTRLSDATLQAITT